MSFFVTSVFIMEEFTALCKGQLEEISRKYNLLSELHALIFLCLCAGDSP